MCDGTNRPVTIWSLKFLERPIFSGMLTIVLTAHDRRFESLKLRTACVIFLWSLSVRVSLVVSERYKTIGVNLFNHIVIAHTAVLLNGTRKPNWHANEFQWIPAIGTKHFITPHVNSMHSPMYTKCTRKNF